MDAFLQMSSPDQLTLASASTTAVHSIAPAPAMSALVTPTTKGTVSADADDEGLKAWQMLTKSGPVTQATFLAWYATHNKKTKKRAASASTKPAAKKQHQVVLSGVGASEQPTLTKGKRTALLKAVISSLKTTIKAKATKWHAGDRDVKAGTAVMDPNEFVALFPGVPMTKKGVTTSFSLTEELITTMFGSLTDKLSVPTFSQPRSFQKGYKTGSQSVSLLCAEGKYSTGTSTLTLKFALIIGGGYDGAFYHNDDGDY
mmetsp:Transcript_10739/g.13578  ORF Transcript_10739/g.13578 Transcript_10739/m.13578 type:complete len:258 (-) Transcript_10739:102-875(-)